MKLYHISYIFNRESILSEGLKPNSIDSEYIKYSNRICFSNDINRLPFDYVNYGEVDVYEVNIPDDLIHFIKQDENIPLPESEFNICIDFPNENYRLTDLKIIQTID